MANENLNISVLINGDECARFDCYRDAEIFCIARTMNIPLEITATIETRFGKRNFKGGSEVSYHSKV